MTLTDRLRAEVYACPRNDADRAEGVARAIAHELGAVPAETMMYLWMLQDDPSDFDRRIVGIPTTGSAR